MTKPAKPPAAKATTGDDKAEREAVPVHDLVLSSAVQNAAAMLAWSKHLGEPKIDALLGELVDKTKAVTDGNMVPVEAMLYGQAVTLQGMFTNLARRAAGQEYLKQFQAYMTLALKAQAQCRATLEALAEIKNPRPVAFVRQANFANGPQQVNNATSTRPPARTEQDGNLQNGLLEAPREQWLDTRAQGKAGGANPALETVGTGHGAAHG